MAGSGVRHRWIGIAIIAVGLLVATAGCGTWFGELTVGDPMLDSAPQLGGALLFLTGVAAVVTGVVVALRRRDVTGSGGTVVTVGLLALLMVLGVVTVLADDDDTPSAAACRHGYPAAERSIDAAAGPGRQVFWSFRRAVDDTTVTVAQVDDPTKQGHGPRGTWVRTSTVLHNADDVAARLTPTLPSLTAADRRHLRRAGVDLPATSRQLRRCFDFYGG